MDGVWIPIVMFVAFAISLVAYFYFNNQSKLSMHSTLQAAISSGQQLSPELIEKLGSKNCPLVDFRRGVVLIALSIAMALFAMVESGEWDEIMFAIFPLMLGIAFLVVWKMNPENK